MEHLKTRSRITKVIPASPAAAAGICPDDVVLQAFDKYLLGYLEIMEICWDKAGEKVELIVLRANSSDRLQLTMDVGSISESQLNRWPLLDECWQNVRTYMRSSIQSTN